MGNKYLPDLITRWSRLFQSSVTGRMGTAHSSLWPWRFPSHLKVGVNVCVTGDLQISLTIVELETSWNLEHLQWWSCTIPTALRKWEIFLENTLKRKDIQFLDIIDVHPNAPGEEGIVWRVQDPAESAEERLPVHCGFPRCDFFLLMAEIRHL